MKKKVVIIDYGLGNIRSAQNSIQEAIKLYNIEGSVERSSDHKSLIEATHIVLPGQGAFEACMNGLKNLKDMIEELHNQVIINKKPILGICVGMQLLADKGFENGNHKGLGWVRGNIIKIPNNTNVLPHMGWNQITCSTKHPILNEIYNEHYFFVHSYYFEAKNKKDIIAYSNYGIEFPALIVKENIIGVQFHPEKSSKAGIKLLSNFLLST